MDKKELLLLDYNSELWEVYRGAYGNVVEDVQILMQAIPAHEKLKLRRLWTEAKDNYEIAFENICENLYHQLSFYDATYITMPYLVTLLEQKEQEQDLEWQIKLISEMGVCLMTDISEINTEVIEDEEILENYEFSISILQEKTKTFLKQNIEKLKELDKNRLAQFYVSVLAILGDREAAFSLTSLMFNECYVVCGNCDFCDEEMEPFSCGKPEQIIPRESVIGTWDKKSFEDTYVWFSNFLHIVGADDMAEILSYYYGTYTCPECGAKENVMECIKRYFFDIG